MTKEELVSKLADMSESAVATLTGSVLVLDLQDQGKILCATFAAAVTFRAMATAARMPAEDQEAMLSLARSHTGAIGFADLLLNAQATADRIHEETAS